jgi:hypothetical protein
MRPTPEEVIAGVRAILKQEIATVIPKQAQPQLRRVMAVLRDARWNEAAFELMRENAIFAGLARVGAARVGREPGLDSLGAELASAAHFDAPGSFVEANAINRRLREALARLIERIRDERLTVLDDLCAAIGRAMLALRDDL